MVSSSALLSGLLIKHLDHLGLVAGICKELKIAETIDAIIPKSQDCHVTHGQALVALRWHSKFGQVVRFLDITKSKSNLRGLKSVPILS